MKLSVGTFFFTWMYCDPGPGFHYNCLQAVGRSLSRISYYLSSYVFKNLYVDLEKQTRSDSCKKRKNVS